VKHVAAFERAELAAAPMPYDYKAAQPMTLPAWMGASA
jgi:hypothetical protein